MTSAVDVPPGTLVVFSDIGCPWAHVAVHRLHAARAKLGLGAAVRFDHRPFPLEIVNERPTPMGSLARESQVLAHVEPGAGWQEWKAEPSTWPVTTLLALEAVEAAKEQGLEASEHLDAALRRAMFAENRCISMRHVILEVAEACGRVDSDALREALDDGRARRPMLDHYWTASEAVRGSPHLFLPDGSDAHNPGVTFEMDDDHRPVIQSDEPQVYDELVGRAAGAG